MTGLKEVLTNAGEGAAEEEPQLSKLQILETGLAVLLQVAAECTGSSAPLEAALQETKTELATAKEALANVSHASETHSKGTSKYRDAYNKEASLRAEAEARADAMHDELIELRSMRESLDRKIKALKDKHAQEVTALEDELAELARKNEEQRVRSQSSSNEVVEKKVSATIESYTDKMKRAVSATETLWKAKLKAAQDDQVRRCFAFVSSR